MNATSTRNGSAPAIRAGTLDRDSRLRATKKPMIASGTRIETMVRVWRRRPLSDTRSMASALRVLVERGGGLRRRVDGRVHGRSDATGSGGWPGVGRLARRRARAAHSCEGPAPSAGGGSTRPFPRARFRTLEIGVSVRTKYDARPARSRAFAMAASSPSGVDGSHVDHVVGHAHLERAVRVRGGDPGQAQLPRERCRPLVPAAAHDPGVVGLDPVHQLADRLEPRVREHGAPVTVERVRDPDQPALRAHLGDRLARPAAPGRRPARGTARSGPRRRS